jgi:hypothetical protein
VLAKPITSAAVVKVILRVISTFLSLLSGSDTAIATTLDDAGCVPKRGKRFYPSTIRYMLDNPKYRGLIEYYFQHDGEAHCLSEGSHEGYSSRRSVGGGNKQNGREV